jgi:hypothetical protein
MTKGLEVYLDDLKKINANIKLLNLQNWELKNGTAFRYIKYFENGKTKKVYFDVKKVSEIFPKIKYIYDNNGEVIAQRVSINCRLITIRKNKYFNRSSPKNKVEMSVYNLINFFEDKEYFEKITQYWYVDKEI